MSDGIVRAPASVNAHQGSRRTSADVVLTAVPIWLSASFPRQGVGAADDVGDHRRIEVSADLDNEVTVEMAHPAVLIVERDALGGRRDRLEFSDGVVTMPPVG
jgi:hypothetical protein